MTIVAIIVFVVLASLTVVGYLLNARTPKPEGCENITSQCEGCSISTCLHNPKLKEEIKHD